MICQLAKFVQKSIKKLDLNHNYNLFIMHIEEFKDVNQVAPHASEHEKQGLVIEHANGDFRKAVLEMSLILTKYVGLIDLLQGRRSLHHQTACIYLPTPLSIAAFCGLPLRAHSLHQRGE